jgi:hypothetical protein
MFFLVLGSSGRWDGSGGRREPGGRRERDVKVMAKASEWLFSRYRMM